MRSKRKRAIQVAVIGLLAVGLASLLWGCRKGPSTLHGAVMERNLDPRKESPIAGVEVTATIGSNASVAQTDASGYFNIPLRRWIVRGQPLRLAFKHPGYQPLELNGTVTDELYLAHMAPVAAKAPPKPDRPEVKLANVRVRYSMKATAAVSVGSAVRTFEVVNTGNVPCRGQSPCSPDGKWKAAVASTMLDAGQGNEFRNVRLSCIAGPCPFTRVETDGYSRGGNKITASVLDWSDTATFLLEAEVYHPMESEVMQQSYPVIFGHTMNFSVPDTAEGVSLEADVNGEAVVFPLGPSLCLEWADCTLAKSKDHSKSYRCELKDGYQFQ